jgi:hypothetical protein
MPGWTRHRSPISRALSGSQTCREPEPPRNPDGSVETLLFDTDMRFMQGTYVGLDGAVHHATFGFV